jgi:death-on-curing protein
MDFLYFDTPHAISVHDNIITKTGGLSGVINIGLLDSAIEHIKNDMYYPLVEDKATHLLFSINKNHAFQDGNKRSSLALSAYFLEINGFSFMIEKFIIKMENIVVSVADNIIDKDLLKEIITSLIYEDDYSEEIKLKIFRALSQ